MKTTARVKRLLLAARAVSAALAAALALTLPACDKSSEPRFGNKGGEEATSTIARLKSLCTGECTPVTADITVGGVVTANDLYGEFHKTLVIQDESGGISIAVDGAELYVDYPVGAAVTVYCNGLTLCDYGGKVQLGTTPADAYGAGRIPRAELGRYLRVSGDGGNPLRPAALTFGEIGPRHIDTYVYFNGVHFAETGNWCDTDPETGRPVTTERLLADGTGRTLPVRTSGTCTYATEPVPQGTGSIYGVIDYFNGKYTLRVTNREIDFATGAGLPTAYP